MFSVFSKTVYPPPEAPPGTPQTLPFTTSGGYPLNCLRPTKHCKTHGFALYGPKTAQHGSKMAPEGSETAQESPKTAQDSPKMAQEAHNKPQESPDMIPKKAPRGKNHWLFICFFATFCVLIFSSL